MLDFKEPLPHWAIGTTESFEDKLVAGAQLCTKDGRVMGNAFIAEFGFAQVDISEFESLCGHMEFYRVFTDMGDELTMTRGEIEECFHEPRYIMDVENALASRGIVL